MDCKLDDFKVPCLDSIVIISLTLAHFPSELRCKFPDLPYAAVLQYRIDRGIKPYQGEMMSEKYLS